MYQRILTKPRKWDERSLALATKEELIADLLLRQARMNKRRRICLGQRICFSRKNFLRKKELYWIEMLKQELACRSQWVIEEQ